jgi:hypothetical protein
MLPPNVNYLPDGYTWRDKHPSSHPLRVSLILQIQFENNWVINITITLECSMAELKDSTAEANSV